MIPISKMVIFIINIFGLMWITIFSCDSCQKKNFQNKTNFCKLQKCSQESDYFKWSTITWESNDKIKVYHTIHLCSSTGLLHPSKTTSSTSIEWQSVHKVIFSHEWPSYLQLKQFKQSLNYEFQHSYAAWNPTGGISHLSRSSRQEF